MSLKQKQLVEWLDKFVSRSHASRYYRTRCVSFCRF